MKNEFDMTSNVTEETISVDKKSSGGFLKIFLLVLVLLLAITVLRKLLGNSSSPTLYSFLQMLESMPNLSIPFLSVPTNDGGFLSFIVGVVNFVIFLINGLMSVVTVVTYFFKWLFL